MQTVAMVLAPAGELVLRHVKATLEAAEDEGLPVVDLAERVRADDRALSLTQRVLRASAETVDAPQKLVALGRVLAYGLDDDAQFDTAVLLSTALVDLERVHIRTLEAFARTVTAEEPAGEPSDGQGDRRERDLAQVEGYAGGPVVARSFIAVTTRHGLVVERVDSLFGANVPYWRIGELGHQLLALLRDVDLDEVSPLTSQAR